MMGSYLVGELRILLQAICGDTTAYQHWGCKTRLRSVKAYDQIWKQN